MPSAKYQSVGGAARARLDGDVVLRPGSRAPPPPGRRRPPRPPRARASRARRRRATRTSSRAATADGARHRRGVATGHHRDRRGDLGRRRCSRPPPSRRRGRRASTCPRRRTTTRSSVGRGRQPRTSAVCRGVGGRVRRAVVASRNDDRGDEQRRRPAAGWAVRRTRLTPAPTRTLSSSSTSASGSAPLAALATLADVTAARLGRRDARACATTRRATTIQITSDTASIAHRSHWSAKRDRHRRRPLDLEAVGPAERLDVARARRRRVSASHAASYASPQSTVPGGRRGSSPVTGSATPATSVRKRGDTGATVADGHVAGRVSGDDAPAAGATPGSRRARARPWVGRRARSSWPASASRSRGRQRRRPHRRRGPAWSARRRSARPPARAGARAGW